MADKTEGKKKRRERGSGSIYQINGAGPLWISYRGSDGRRIAESSESHLRGDAQRLLDKRIGAKAHNLPVIAHAEKLTFVDAAQAVVDDYVANSKKSLNVTQSRITNHLKPYFVQRRLVGITTADVNAYIVHRRTEGIQRERNVPIADGKTERRLVRVEDVSNAEVNRELQILKRIFGLAIKSGRIAMKPHIPLLHENNVRKGFFEHAQFEAVLQHLPVHLQPVATFAYLTGWRTAAEILPLEWRQVDFRAGEITLDPGETKNGEGRTFPMTAALRTLLEAQQVERERLKKSGHIEPLVFVRMVSTRRRGPKTPKRIGSFNKSWKAACTAAGVPGRLLHDFRRTAVRNLVRAGIPERVAMTMTGHKTRSVFERYNIVSQGDLKDAAAKLDAATTPSLGSKQQKRRRSS